MILIIHAVKENILMHLSYRILSRHKQINNISRIISHVHTFGLNTLFHRKRFYHLIASVATAKQKCCNQNTVYVFFHGIVVL